MTLRLRSVSHSEIGLVRKNNQDSGYASPHLLVVADGMGGAAAGDLASAVAVEVIRGIDAPTEGDQMLPVLAGAIAAANDRIAELVEADLALDGMGTTVTGALFDGHELGLAHIGDSRAYLLRAGALERLTRDHSWVQSLVDDGKIDESEASAHPHRSLLLRVLNGQPANEPDLTRVSLQDGDRLLLCSDGLCGLVEDDVIAQALGLPDLQQALETLVSEARAEGGIDNITVIVADVLDGVPAASVDTVEAVVLGAAAERRVPASPAAGAGLLDGPDDEDEDGAATDSAQRRSGSSVLHGSLVEGDEARYNPQPPDRRRVLRSLAGVVVSLLVVAAALGAAYAWGRTQYYVGAHGAQVAIFRGLPERVVVPLSTVFEVQPLAMEDLPPFYADQVRAGIEVAGLDSARQTVAELTEASLRCTRPGGTGTATPRPPRAPARHRMRPPFPGPLRRDPGASSAPATAGPGC